MDASRWGKTKSGKSFVPVGIMAGIVLGMAIGTVYWLLNRSDPHGWVTALVIAIVSAPLCFSFVAIFAVDRTTMKDAVPRPEESIESSWLQEAGNTAFMIVMTTVALFEIVAIFVPSLRDLHLHHSWLWSVVVLGWASLGLSYMAIKRRES